ncbi:MAG TPA: hypothetical protein VHJ82_09045 [Actinomycetota bacterium]|nr:hypothetical protein [Actinomycetota bacterium]
MPARRTASSGKKTTGRQKRALKRVPGDDKGRGSRASSEEIRAKTPPSRKVLARLRDSVAERRKRKSGVADSAIREPKPPSNKTTAKKTAARKRAGNTSSGQKAAVRKRDAAPAPTRARRQNTGGKQKSTRRRGNAGNK